MDKILMAGEILCDAVDTAAMPTAGALPYHQYEGGPRIAVTTAARSPRRRASGEGGGGVPVRRSAVSGLARIKSTNILREMFDYRTGE
jgi:hypothetical protein